jgi:hypothetical protein
VSSVEAGLAEDVAAVGDAKQVLVQPLRLWVDGVPAADGAVDVAEVGVSEQVARLLAHA